MVGDNPCWRSSHDEIDYFQVCWSLDFNRTPLSVCMYVYIYIYVYIVTYVYSIPTCTTLDTSRNFWTVNTEWDIYTGSEK